MGHFPWPWYAMISRGYPFHIPMVCLKKPISVCQTGCISARILVKKTGLTLLLILITLLLLLIYVLYIYTYRTYHIYIYGCPTCCFPLVNPLRHPLTHVLRIGMEKPSMDSTICWCRRTPSPSPPSTGTSRSRRRPLPQPRKNRLVDGWISWELYLS